MIVSEDSKTNARSATARSRRDQRQEQEYKQEKSGTRDRSRSTSKKGETAAWSSVVEEECTEVGEGKGKGGNEKGHIILERKM